MSYVLRQVHNSLKKDYEIDWFSSLMFVLYDAMQKTRDFDNKYFRVGGFFKIPSVWYDVKIYDFLSLSKLA